ncbi:COX15/CtaA family protein [Halorientalis salina]|uniref:COX15/CtaA family protein n=1 Tax=Halorientalis salina TaxID=2932266 RepID=UPI0010ACEF2A|nr:COX15/CtaA family protein [Halorientalis salina]
MRRLPFRRLAAVTAASTFLLMLVGAYTKAIGAGLACPDWPTCYGTWVPFLHPAVMAETPYSTLQVAAEWVHRTLAAGTGLLIAATAVAAWRRESLDRPEWAALGAGALLPVQVVLGGLTVTESLAPLIVTAHLGTAILIFAGVVAAAVGRRVPSQAAS